MEGSLKKTRRRYSEREKAAALATYDATGNLSEAARISGIPDSTIHGWLSDKPSIASSDVSLLRAGYEVPSIDLADRFEEIAHLSTGEIGSRLRDPKQVKDIPLTHLLRASEVGTDKSQLLRGLPTSISGEVERRELIVILQSALDAGLDPGDLPECIDVQPEPAGIPSVMPERAVAMAPAVEDPSSKLPAILFRHPLNDCPTS